MNFILVLNLLNGPMTLYDLKTFPSERSCAEFGKVISGDIPKRLKIKPFFCIPIVPKDVRTAKGEVQ